MNKQYPHISTLLAALPEAMYRGTNISIHGCNSLSNLKAHEIGFYSGNDVNIIKKYCSYDYVIVCHNMFSNVIEDGNFVFCDNPRYVFATIVSAIMPNTERVNRIGKNFVAGKSCSIKNAIIKDNVTIHSGVRIGENGFGYAHKDDKSPWVRFPHFGMVIIEDNVEIGSNTCIDRGSLSDTIIRPGVKIDNLVHIAHNVEIGSDTMIIAGSIIGGSAKIGKNCWLSMGCKVLDNVSICDNVTIGAGAVVLRNITESGIWAGVPARKIK